MSKRFREHQPEQMLMLPPSLNDWLPEGHLSRFISDVVRELDLRAVYQSYAEKDGRGQAAYHPLMMVKLLWYGYCVGVVASRKIEAATYDQVAFRYLAANQHPDHDSIAEFRRRHLPAMTALFLEVLKLCQKAGLVKRGHVALDGTQIKANASRHRNCSYAGLTEREKELARQVEQILAEAERAERADDQRFGRGRRGDELPPELAEPQKRLQKIREAKAELERPAREEAEEKKAEAEKRLRERREKAAAAGRPLRGKLPRIAEPAKAQPGAERKVNRSDADSRIMRERAGGFIQGFNAQAAVDGHAQVIVAADVTRKTDDRAQWAPMLEPVEHNSGAKPAMVSADTGYYSPKQVPAPVLEGIDLYVRPDAPPKVNEGKIASRAGPQQRKPPRSGYGPEGIPRIVHLRAKLATPEGQAIYAKRREIVEPAFGQIKQWRGFRQFLLRGLEKTRAEWRLICLTHNLLKLFRFRLSLHTT